jgi:sugar transferase (PEP-CTERM/EpsH1 system associated)
MIQHLGRKHSVVVASLAHSEEELNDGSPLRDHCEDVIAEILPSSRRWIQAGSALLSSVPSSVAYFWSRRLAERIKLAWKGSAFDAIIVHCAFAAQYVRDLPCSFRMLDFGDIDSAKWSEYSHQRAFPLSMGYRVESAKLRKYEKKVASQFDLCTATTRGELEELQKLGNSIPSAVIPNGVDLSYFHPRSETPEDSSLIVFLGRMDYYPNVDGVLYFAKEIFPAIRKEVPRAEFRIVGSNPSRVVRDLSKIPGISVTGYVPDVRPYLMDAALAVAPLRIARGTQNKILQFLAMGVPVVTTPQAAKGVAADSGRHFLVADGSEPFARQVLRLLQDPALRETLSVAGRQPLEEAHCWPASMQILDRLLENHSTRLQPPTVVKSSGEPA